MADLNVLYLLNFVLKCRTTCDLKPSRFGAQSAGLLSSPARQRGSPFRMHNYLRTEIFWDIIQ
jgi:hypothetical protein